MHWWSRAGDYQGTHTADARNVRVIVFEKALATLDTAHQPALLLTYRDRQGHTATAA
ncbi:hypothetical protein P8935_22000 [Telmatobacter sp. DSM 110680]|uniref:Uncharacterized protein n=1 Tax=Telmatobacter sp. DSM 110680 TaxID=3036704 RepID=A0AAU7DGP7_9BACT